MRRIVLATLLLALAIFLTVEHLYFAPYKEPWMEEVATLPFLGSRSANLQMVLFEDFQCEGCRDFHQETLPILYEKYLRNGKAGITFVPLAILDGSDALATAALFAYREKPSQYMEVSRALFFLSSERSEEDRFAAFCAEFGINHRGLALCLEKECEQKRLQDNLALARLVMTKRVGTPLLFLNGDPIAIRGIDEILSRRLQQLSYWEQPEETIHL